MILWGFTVQILYFFNIVPPPWALLWEGQIIDSSSASAASACVDGSVLLVILKCICLHTRKTHEFAETPTLCVWPILWSIWYSCDYQVISWGPSPQTVIVGSKLVILSSKNFYSKRAGLSGLFLLLPAFKRHSSILRLLGYIQLPSYRWYVSGL